MAKVIAGHLEVGTNDYGEVVMNSPNTEVDAKHCAHWTFSPSQARNLARILIKKSREADKQRFVQGREVEAD